MAYRAVQTRVLYSLAIIPRNLHGTPHSIQFRVDLNTLTRSRSIHNRDKRSLCNAAHSRALRIYSCYSHATTRRVPSKHTIATLPLRPVLLYIITLRCFPSHFSSFYFFSADLAADRTCRTTQYTATPLFCSHAARQPVRLQSSHASSLRCAATFRLRALFSSFSRTFRQVRGSFCRRTAVRPPRPASFDSLYSRKRCRGAHFFAFSFHVEHTSCHSPKPQRLSRFLLVYAYLYIASLHVFSPMRLLFPSLRSFPRCRSAADDRASALLRRFCFRAPHRRPACRFRRRSFAFRFSAVVSPSFLLSRSLFASCSMAHRKLFVCFSLLPAFRAFPSMIRSASSPVFDQASP